MRTSNMMSAALGVMIGCAGIASSTYAADWSDIYLGYRVSDDYHDPNVKGPIRKDIVTLGGVSGFKYGTNAFNLDVLKSGDNEPAAHSTNGATEIYFLYRGQLEYGKITGKPIKFGPIKDIGFSYGFDLETMNNAVDPGKQVLVLGPTLKFDVPGTLDLSLQYYKENNHNSFGLVNKDISFDPAYQLNAVWNIPFQIGRLPMKFQGNGTWRSAKGKDYNGNPTAPETLVRTSVMADIGTLVNIPKNTFYAGIGYERWHNKFGYQSSVPGSNTSAPSLQLEYHF